MLYGPYSTDNPQAKCMVNVRPLLAVHLTLDIIQPQSGGLLCTLELPSVATVGAGDI